MSSKIKHVSHPQQVGRVKVALLAAGVAAYQVLVYCITSEGSGLGEVLMAAPLLVVAGCVIARTSRGRAFLILLTAAAILGFLVWPDFGASPTWLYPVPIVTIYLVLLWTFARTLRPGREPLITRLATHVHGEIPAEITRYTRRVTWAWCVFFAAMTLISTLLFKFAPLAVWSVFNSLLNLPLIVAMYLGEYAWRRWRYPDFSHASIATVFRAARTFDFKRPAAGR